MAQRRATASAASCCAPRREARSSRKQRGRTLRYRSCAGYRLREKDFRRKNRATVKPPGGSQLLLDVGADNGVPVLGDGFLGLALLVERREHRGRIGLS